MRTPACRLLFVLALIPLFGACDSLDQLFGTEDVAVVVSVAELSGKAVEFNSSENAQNTGGHSRWQYSFVGGGGLVGCNDVTSYQASDWFPVDENTVRVAFGGAWEEYEFLSGDWNSGGSFEVRTSLGTSARGTFREISSLSLSGCP